jgi:pyrroloquinoline-quinone synthase
LPALHTIDAIVQSRRLLTHPFYVLWQEGGLGHAGLRDYAVQYYRIEQSLTELATGPEWVDESTHPELWLRFASALGLTRDDVVGAPMRPVTRALVDLNARLSSCEAGRLAALYTYEAQAAEIAATKASSLRVHYGVSSGLEFFWAHHAVEDRHAKAGRRALARVDRRAVETAVAAAADAHWAFLDQALAVASGQA